MLHLIVEAGARLSSHEDAAYAVGLTGLDISPRHLGELTVLAGKELAQTVNGKAEQRRHRAPSPSTGPLELVVVELDGGHLRTREPDCGRGVHNPHNREEKIACLATLEGKTYEEDPQPQPPESFLQPRRVQRLVRQMAGQAAEASGPQAASEEPQEAEPVEVPRLSAKAGDPQAEWWAPRCQVRTAVASLCSSEKFGPLMAGEAHARGFYEAKRKAFVGDGQAYNWSIWSGYFPDFEPIVDLLHVLCYLYTAAYAVHPTAEEGWQQYEQWLVQCWQGRVAEVIEELCVWEGRVGKPPPGEELPKRDPRRAVAEGLSYLSNNRSRMDYPRYRRAGLPLTSSLVESLVGQFNARVKDRKKFWNDSERAEAILQVRAAYLSEDGRLAKHFAERPGCLYYRRPKPN